MFSGTFRGSCLGREQECEDQCTNFEHTLHGQCHFEYLWGYLCFCYVCGCIIYIRYLHPVLFTLCCILLFFGVSQLLAISTCGRIGKMNLGPKGKI